MPNPKPYVTLSAKCPVPLYVALELRYDDPGTQKERHRVSGLRL